MGHIKDNIYIEDSLITCAEYQIFIDDMRAQGKYFHPDHWKSFQFQTGEAQMPIRGVRFSDALAFCEWLTNRENNEWRYRLPTFEEARKSPAVLNASCWATSLDNAPYIIPSITYFDNRYKVSIAFSKTLAISKDFLNYIDTLFDIDNSVTKVINIDDIVKEFSTVVLPEKEPEKPWYHMYDYYGSPKSPYYKYKHQPTREYITQAFKHAHDIANGLQHLVLRDVDFNYHLDADVSNFIRLADILVLHITSYIENFKKNNKNVNFYDDDDYFPDYERNEYAGNIRLLLYESSKLAIECSSVLDKIHAYIQRFSSTTSYEDGYSIIVEVDAAIDKVMKIKSNISTAKIRAGSASYNFYIDLVNEVNYLDKIFDFILSLSGMTLIIIHLELRRTNTYLADESIRVVKELRI